ncbi:c-type cytochrome [Duganella sp. sic0402]|uniref:c-type cytochrome n=1 Tax=Duganella sp. sic0402 TaxID=2854786 RepID=UPI001C47EE54|nr:c-type cytochrome [Duganella sp. sic0402]MBV7537780.1 c-type cytochrome [Duganella sp. sic0402]
MKKLLMLAAMLAAVTTATAAAPDAAKIEKTYTTTCAACHAAGIMGAPKVGDKAAWKPRIAKGKPALYASAISGVKMMPPRGGNPGLKDDELKAIVDYMIGKSN